MYEVKNTGGGRRRIRDIRAQAPAKERIELEHDLRAAFAREELAVSYQPIVRSGDGLITGVEAFVRWSDRVRGAVPPRRWWRRPTKELITRSAPGSCAAPARTP